jgi:hypothetical protein
MRSSYVEPAHRSGKALAGEPRVRSWNRSTRSAGVGRAASIRAPFTGKRRGDPGSR